MTFALNAITWGLTSLLIVILASLPIGVQPQLALAAFCLAVMFLIKAFDLKGVFRSLYLALGTFVILRYFFWRFSSTLPPISSPFDFVPGVILALAEFYCIAMMFLSLFSAIQPITRRPAAKVSSADAPTVDVFVPSYNEPLEIVAATLAAAKAMHYPQEKLRIFLLDDGATQQKLDSDDYDAASRAAGRARQFKKLCAELGVTYLARERNEHAKAGNLNNGLDHSDGDLVLVLDADHAPSRVFLNETVGHFLADEKLFLVQTPHFFLNGDPIERNLGLDGAPSENEMFYGLVQKGLDKWNSAFFCGSAALLRRQALEEVGGFSGSSVTEDAETALELHSRGWKSLYVDKPMVAGLQPETFAAFIGQRSRWARGMMQILMLKSPIWTRGLSMAQRLCYLSSTMFWLFPLSRMVFLFAPLAYIFFDLKIYMANSNEFVAYTATYMLAALMIQSYVFGRVRWPWISDLYEYVQAVMLFPAVLGVFVDPRRPRFNVTAKGQKLDESRLSSIANVYFLLFGLIVVSAVALAFRFAHEPQSRALILVVGVWTAFNLALTGLGLGAVSELRERRAAPRAETRLKAEMAFGDQTWPAMIENVSTSGFRARLAGAASINPNGSGVLRVLNEVGVAMETPVVNLQQRIAGENRSAGFRFYGDNADRFRIVAGALFADAGAIHARKSKRYSELGVAEGTLWFVTLALKQTARGLFYLLFRRGERAATSAAAASEESAQ